MWFAPGVLVVVGFDGIFVCYYGCVFYDDGQAVDCGGVVCGFVEVFWFWDEDDVYCFMVFENGEWGFAVMLVYSIVCAVMCYFLMQE